MKKLSKELIARAEKHDLEIGYNSKGLYSIYKLENGYTLSDTLENYKNVRELTDKLDSLEYSDWR